MAVFIILGFVVLAFVAWGIRYDLKQRRLKSPLTDHSTDRAARRARADADAHGGMNSSDGGLGPGGI